MQRKEFENRIKNLLPKVADDVVESWAAYATELDHYGTEVVADFYDKNYIALLLVKQRHGEEIATQLFNFGKCFTFNYFELQGAAEKLTGKRIILHKKREKPDICGYACRCPGKYNSALCGDCPVAEAFFAECDGVELVYAI